MPASPRSGRKTPGSLRTWLVQHVVEGDGAYITCQHCQHTAGVDLPSWLSAGELGTRPCTYCFKTSRIPEEDT